MHPHAAATPACHRAGCQPPERPAEGPSRYHPRDPSASPLFRLIDTYYQKVKGAWEERFEHRYGYWRGFVDAAINRFLSCGDFECGFARVWCPECHAEFLVGFSCRGRQLCPSCGAKRAAAFAAFLADEVLEHVDHDQWVFSLPKILRPYFIYHRELLGSLCRLAYDTVRELMAALVSDDDSFRPGMVAQIQTFGSRLNANPHVHAIVSRGGWSADGRFIPLPQLDHHAAELLFRHKVLGLLKREDLIDDDRIEVMHSWQHTGFSIHNDVSVDRDDRAGLERLARYLMRSPVSLERIRYDEDTEQVTYALKAGASRHHHAHDVHEPEAIEEEKLDAMEFVARVLVHIPEPKLHLVHYYGAYSAVLRARRRKARCSAQAPADPDHEDDLPTARQRRRLWANLIRRVYQADPLRCARCGATMRIISFITDPKTIRKILDHIKSQAASKRGPPPTD